MEPSKPSKGSSGYVKRASYYGPFRTDPRTINFLSVEEFLKILDDGKLDTVINGTSEDDDIAEVDAPSTFSHHFASLGRGMTQQDEMDFLSKHLWKLNSSFPSLMKETANEPMAFLARLYGSNQFVVLHSFCRMARNSGHRLAGYLLGFEGDRKVTPDEGDAPHRMIIVNEWPVPISQKEVHHADPMVLIKGKELYQTYGTMFCGLGSSERSWVPALLPLPPYWAAVLLQNQSKWSVIQVIKWILRRINKWTLYAGVNIKLNRLDSIHGLKTEIVAFLCSACTSISHFQNESRLSFPCNPFVPGLDDVKMKRWTEDLLGHLFLGKPRKITQEEVKGVEKANKNKSIPDTTTEQSMTKPSEANRSVGVPNTGSPTKAPTASPSGAEDETNVTRGAPNSAPAPSAKNVSGPVAPTESGASSSQPDRKLKPFPKQNKISSDLRKPAPSTRKLDYKPFPKQSKVASPQSPVAAGPAPAPTQHARGTAPQRKPAPSVYSPTLMGSFGNKTGAQSISAFLEKLDRGHLKDAIESVDVDPYLFSNVGTVKDKLATLGAKASWKKELDFIKYYMNSLQTRFHDLMTELSMNATSADPYPIAFLARIPGWAKFSVFHSFCRITGSDGGGKLVAFRDDGNGSRLPVMYEIPENNAGVESVVGRVLRHVDPLALLYGADTFDKNGLASASDYIGGTSYCSVLLPLPWNWAAILLHNRSWSAQETVRWITNQISKWVFSKSDQATELASRKVKAQIVAFLAGSCTKNPYTLMSELAMKCKEKRLNAFNRDWAFVHINNLIATDRSKKRASWWTSLPAQDKSPNKTSLPAQGKSPKKAEDKTTSGPSPPDKAIQAETPKTTPAKKTSPPPRASTASKSKSEVQAKDAPMSIESFLLSLYDGTRKGVVLNVDPDVPFELDPTSVCHRFAVIGAFDTAKEEVDVMSKRMKHTDFSALMADLKTASDAPNPTPTAFLARMEGEDCFIVLHSFFQLPDNRVVAFVGDGSRTKLPDMVLVSDDDNFETGRKIVHIDPRTLIEGGGMTEGGTQHIGQSGEQSYCPMLLPLPLKWAAILLYNPDWNVARTAAWIVNKIARWTDKTVSTRKTQISSLAFLCGACTSESETKPASRLSFPCKRLGNASVLGGSAVAHLNRLFPNLQEEDVSESPSNVASETASNADFTTDMDADSTPAAQNDTILQPPPVHNLMLPTGAPTKQGADGSKPGLKSILHLGSVAGRGARTLKEASGRLISSAQATFSGRKRQATGSDDEASTQHKVARRTSENAKSFVGKPFPRQSRVSRRAYTAGTKEPPKTASRAFPKQAKVVRKASLPYTSSPDEEPQPKKTGEADQAILSTPEKGTIGMTSDVRTTKSDGKLFAVRWSGQSQDREDITDSTKQSGRRASREPPAWRKLSVGSRVAVYWEEDEQYYSAVVLDRYGGSSNMSVKYEDDGLVEKLDMAKEKIRVLEESEGDVTLDVELTAARKKMSASRGRTDNHPNEPQFPKQIKRRMDHSTQSESGMSATGTSKSIPSFPRQTKVARKPQKADENVTTGTNRFPSFPKQGRVGRKPLAVNEESPAATSTAPHLAFPRQFKVSRKMPQPGENDDLDTKKSPRFPSFPKQSIVSRKEPAQKEAVPEPGAGLGSSGKFPTFPKQSKVARKAAPESSRGGEINNAVKAFPKQPKVARKIQSKLSANEEAPNEETDGNKAESSVEGVPDPSANEVIQQGYDANVRDAPTPGNAGLNSSDEKDVGTSLEQRKANGDEKPLPQQHNVVFGEPHFLVTTNPRPGDTRLGVRECVLCQFRFRGRRGNKSLGTVSTACAQCGRCYHVACFAAAHNIERLKRENPDEYQKISGWEEEMATLSKKRRSVVVPDTTYATLTLPELEK